MKKAVPWAGIAALLVVGILAAVLGAFALVSVDESHLLITDPEDEAIPADYDALLLEGDMQGDTFVIELTVRGTVQPNYAIGVDGSIHMPAYQIMLLTKEKSSDRDTATYLLTYIDGVERNYGIRAQATASVLRLEFPTDLLLSKLHIVGMDAAIFSAESQDYVQGAPRESLQVQKVVTLPIGPYAMLVASAACFAISIVLIVLKVKARAPPVQGSLNTQDRTAKLKQEEIPKEKV